MARDKTAVERGLTKREPIGHSKTSLNLDSVHCIRSSNKNEEQQDKSIHVTSPKALERPLLLDKRGSGNEIGHDRTVI